MGGSQKNSINGAVSGPKVFALRAAKNESNRRFVCLSLGLLAAGAQRCAGIGRNHLYPPWWVVGIRRGHSSWTSQSHGGPPPHPCPTHPPVLLPPVLLSSGDGGSWSGPAGWAVSPVPVCPVPLLPCAPRGGEVGVCPSGPLGLSEGLCGPVRGAVSSTNQAICSLRPLGAPVLRCSLIVG